MRWTPSFISYSPELFEPPGGNAFQHSPSICDVHRNGYSEQAYMVATAGDRIWCTNGSGWEKMTDIPVASAPDCTLTADGRLRVVALTAQGTVLHAWGAFGVFSAMDLGGY